MKLIDDSPGLFITLAFGVVYGVIGVEAWMWSAESAVVLAGTLALIVVVAILLMRAMHHFLEDDEDVIILAEEAEARAARDAAPAPVAAPERAHRAPRHRPLAGVH